MPILSGYYLLLCDVSCVWMTAWLDMACVGAPKNVDLFWIFSNFDTIKYTELCLLLQQGWTGMHLSNNQLEERTLFFLNFYLTILQLSHISSGIAETQRSPPAPCHSEQHEFFIILILFDVQIRSVWRKKQRDVGCRIY